jgi:hypothetical protein
MFGLSDKTQPQNSAPVAPFPQSIPSEGSNSALPFLSQNTLPVSPNPAGHDPAPAAAVHSAGPSLPGSDALAKSSINLESAYIPADPPHLAANTDGPAKPSAASLVQSTPPDDLIKIKQQALTNLAPLVDHLDQTPEEKFKITMMLIQASDNADLVAEAYDAANKITDEKDRAQALLDVVNEINYFTQQGVNAHGQSPTGA